MFRLSLYLSVAFVVACALGASSVQAGITVIPSPASDILLSSHGGVADINGSTVDGGANYSGLPPANLNDGERDGYYNNGLGVDGMGNLAHTAGSGAGQEMGVTIPTPVAIGSVDLFDRTDCCGYRIDGSGTVPFTLNIYNGATLEFTQNYLFTPTIFLSGYNPNTNQTETALGMVMFTGGVVGNYVQIVQNNNDYMNLAQLEAYKTPEPASMAIWGAVIAGGLFVARRKKA